MPSNPESSIAENYVYNLLGEYADMSELLESTVICNTPFKKVIMDDATELLGQD